MFRKYFFSLIFCLIIIFSFVWAKAVFASATDGTIDSTYKYAWGENIGWVNFGTASGNVHVTDTGLTGYAWSENYGWINLHANNLAGGHVTNDGEGNLGGNAWGEGIGWIDFIGVTIDENGYFNGYATIANDSSQISFNCSNTSSCGSSDFKIRTDWEVGSDKGTGTRGGGRVLGYNWGVVSCADGIMNGDEAGIDCGGSCPTPCEIFIPEIPAQIPTTAKEISGKKYFYVPIPLSLTPGKITIQKVDSSPVVQDTKKAGNYINTYMVKPIVNTFNYLYSIFDTYVVEPTVNTAQYFYSIIKTTFLTVLKRAGLF